MAKTLKDYFGFKSTPGQPSKEEVDHRVFDIPDPKLEIVEDTLVEPKLGGQKSSKKNQVVLNKRKRNSVFSSNSSDTEHEKSPLRSKHNKVRKKTAQSDINTASCQKLCESSQIELKLEKATKSNEQSNSKNDSSQEYSPLGQMIVKPNSILKYFSSCCDQLLKEERMDSGLNNIVGNSQEYVSDNRCDLEVKNFSKQKHVILNKTSRDDAFCLSTSESKPDKSANTRIKRSRKNKGVTESKNDSLDEFNSSSQTDPMQNKSRKMKKSDIKNDSLQVTASSSQLEPKSKILQIKKKKVDNKNEVVHEFSSSPQLELKQKISRGKKNKVDNKNDLICEFSSLPHFQIKSKQCSRKKKGIADIQNSSLQESSLSSQHDLQPKKYLKKEKQLDIKNNLLQEPCSSSQLELKPKKSRNRKNLSNSKNDSSQDEEERQISTDISPKVDGIEQHKFHIKTKSKKDRKNKDESDAKNDSIKEFPAMLQMDLKPNSIVKYFSSNSDNPLTLGKKDSGIDMNSALCVSEEKASDTTCNSDNVIPNEPRVQDNLNGREILVLKETLEEIGRKKPRWSMRLKLEERMNNEEGSPLEACKLSTEEFDKVESKSVKDVYEDTVELVEQSVDVVYEKVAETMNQKHGQVTCQSETERPQTWLSMDESKSGRNDSSKSSDEKNIRSSPVLRRSCRVRRPVTKFLVKPDSDDESSAPTSKKNRRTRKKDNSPTLSIDSCSSSEDETKQKVSRKLAPIFVRPKKAAPTAEELAKEAAKMAFLSSGVPDEVKTHKDLIERMENIEYQYVPRISHIQQLGNTDMSWIKLSSSMPVSQRSLIANVPEVLSRKYFEQQSRPCCKPRTLTKKTVYKPKSINRPVIRKFVSEFRSHVDIPVYQLLFRLSKIQGHTSEDLLWSEKYQPRKFRDIVLNKKPIEKLYEWGKNWKSAAKRRRRVSSDSDECEEIGHGAVLISGGFSSGKTTGVYAVAESLGWYFVEINTSMKRSGKNLQCALQEAMQANQMAQSDEKTCAVLIEDVDIVFEEDEDGYYQTLQASIKSSKCPIVMTTSSEKVDPILDSLKTNVDLIAFQSMNRFEIAAYTSCVCLMEGTFIPYNTALELVKFYRKDLRSVLAYVQFWLQDQKPITVEDNCLSKLSLKAKNERNRVTNNDSDEEVTELDEDEVMMILKLDDCEEINLFYCDTFEIPTLGKKGSDTRINKEVELKGISKLAEYLENESSLSLPFIEEQECIVPIWKEFPISGIGDNHPPFRNIEERFQENKLLKNIVDFARRKNFLLSKKNDFSQCAPASFNRLCEESFRTRVDMQQSADKMIVNQLELTNYLSRNNVALDYLPCVRGIYQAETEKIDSNSRRNKRLYHYAKSLDLDIPLGMIQSLLTVFK